MAGEEDSEEISWRVHLSVREGRLQQFIELTAEMVTATREEDGVLIYRRFITEDMSSAHVYEAYRTSEAAVAHLLNFDRVFSLRFSTMVDRVAFWVYGAPSAELRGMLDRFEPVYMRLLGNLDYWG